MAPCHRGPPLAYLASHTLSSTPAPTVKLPHDNVSDSPLPAPRVISLGVTFIKKIEDEEAGRYIVLVCVWRQLCVCVEEERGCGAARGTQCTVRATVSFTTVVAATDTQVVCGLGDKC